MPIDLSSDRVSIHGVRGFSTAEYASSLHGSRARILQTLNEPLTYDDQICYAGFAFRIQAHKEMCPSAAHPGPGFTCIENSNRALPWETRFFESFPWSSVDDRAAFEAEARAAVKESIDRGVPVHYGSEEDGLIIGYGDGGRRWWCLHPYHSSVNEPFWHDEATGFAGGKWPWGICIWTRPKPEAERATSRDLTSAALRQAVEMWGAGARGDYLVGEAGYEKWLALLREVESGALGASQFGMQGNGWYFDVLVHCRRIAGRWLDKVADEFAETPAKDLKKAADHYRRLAEECMEEIGCTWDLALPPARIDNWTSALRREQIRRLESARQHDREAVALIGRALESL